MKAKRKPIYFHEVRDFGSLTRDVLRFLRENAGSFFKGLIFVAGPFVLLFTILHMYYLNEVGEVHLYLRGESRKVDYEMDFYFLWMVIGTGMFLGRVFLSATSAIYLKLYETKGKGNFTTADMSALMRKHLWKFLKTSLIVVVFLWLILGTLLTFYYLLSQVEEGLGLLIFMLSIVAIFIFYFPFSYFNASLSMVIVNYNLSGFKAIRLALRIMKGNFWNAWLVFFVATLATVGLYYLLQLPLAIAETLQELFSSEGIYEYERYGLFMMFLTLLLNFVFTMTDGIYYTFCHFLFYSNLESKSGTGLKNRVLEIGVKKSYHEVEPSY